MITQCGNARTYPKMMTLKMRDGIWPAEERLSLFCVAVMRFRLSDLSFGVFSTSAAVRFHKSANETQMCCHGTQSTQV